MSGRQEADDEEHGGGVAKWVGEAELCVQVEPEHGEKAIWVVLPPSLLEED